MRSGRFGSAQIYYNLLNPSAGRNMSANWSAYDQQNIIGAVEDNGVAVMVIRVLAVGIIATDKS
jgi:D-threo-aldose 1-dehydrogenase